MRAARRRAAALCVAVAAGAALIVPQLGAGEPAQPPLVAEPFLGPEDLQATLLGSVSQGERSGETWAYRRLPLTSGTPVLGDKPLDFGTSADPRDRQLAFLRYTATAGWQVAQTPADENGTPYRGMQPNLLSGRLSPQGGGVLVGRDPARAGAKQLVVLHRNPGGRFKIAAAPPDGVLQPDEALAGDAGAGRVVDATFDEGGRTGLLFAPIGRKLQDGVIHFDGVGWGREPIEIPDLQQGDSFEILALSAAGPRDAWMLARTDTRLGRGISLFRRTIDGNSAKWVDEGDLGGSQFATDPGVTALGGSAEPLTATTAGVWVDGQLPGGKTFTFFYDGGARKVTGSWCDDAATCDHGLGVALAKQDGYRSFAWDGPGFGTRIITNPLDANGAASTNRGTYLRFDGTAFARMPGAGGNGRRGGAFESADEGWLEGPVHVSRAPEGRGPLREWPLTLRSPLTAVAPQPDAPAGDGNASALAVGADGGVTRYTPGKGWVREFLLTSTGAVAHPVLRGVAWPEAGRAYAVGDAGAMWLWRSETGLWEKDSGAPIGFEGNLMDVAFDPGAPLRGYAVGRAGTLLRYDKSWTQEALPSGFESADLTSVSFAGDEALVAAGGDILANSGSGWHVDEGVHKLLQPAQGDVPRILTVTGLPDGGAVAAGRDLVIERDGPGKPWRYADQPLPGATVIAAAAVRRAADPAKVSAVVSVVPRIDYPVDEPLPPPDPNTPPPIQPAFPLAPDGYVLRETAAGWHDEQHSSFGGSGADRPIKTDPVLAFDLNSDGRGWAVGGWSGEADSAGRGSSGRNSQGRADRARVQTAAAYRFGEATGEGPQPSAAGSAPTPLDAGPVRFAVGGHAQCAGPCADLADQSIGPDQTLRSTLAAVKKLSTETAGPRFFLYTGGRLPPGPTTAAPDEEHRFAELLGSETLPVFAAASSGDTAGGSSDAFRSAFAGFGAPFGTGSSAGGISPAGTSAAASPDARTHYAFDSDGTGGKVRVIVIDNSAGSLAASDPHQNPPEPQLPWLEGQLAEAKAAGVPSVVMGSRDLASGFQPALNVASDADVVARALLAGGASAYFYERPEENRQLRIPSGADVTIPEFGTGTLGYRSPISAGTRSTQPDSLFGDAGFLVAEVDAAHVDASSGRAPVNVRLVPAVDDVSMQAIDGTLLRRSRPALFKGLGRRPVGGDRWGDVSPADGNADPPGGDPYTAFPPDLCQIAGCSTRIVPEFSFSSSDDDIGDFVRQDPASTNARKPFLAEDGNPVHDGTSGLFCAFNAGTTTVTVNAGGLSYAQTVTVLPGSVQRPCGTRPLKPSRFPPSTPGVSPPPPAPPSQPPADNPPSNFTPPPPPPPAQVHQPVAPPKAVPTPRPKPAPTPPALPRLTVSAPPPAQSKSVGRVPGSAPPQPPTAVRPIPPGGAVARVYQVEEKKEEELATEESSAFSRYHPEEHTPPERYLIGLALIAALAGAGIRLGGRGRGAPIQPAEARGRISDNPYRRRNR